MGKVAIRALALALVAACCVGCGGGNVERNELIGDFQADYGFGVESLRLSSDGHYQQLFRVKGEDNWTTNSGIWEFKSEAAPIVDLHDSLKVYDDAGKLRSDYAQPVPGARPLQVRKSMRAISLEDAASGRAIKKL